MPLPSKTQSRDRTGAAPSSPGKGEFDLATFFPYLVRIYYRAVSDSVAAVYSTLFGLSVSEWRTMVVLGPNRAMSASDIVTASSMDKVNVSRAVQRLRSAGLLKRDIDGDDRRRAVLRLTDEGVEAFRTLVPLVRQLEAELLDGLSPEERETLIRLMEKVRANAAAIEPPVAP